MKKGDFVRVCNDSYVYEILEVGKDIVTVKDGHDKVYTVKKDKLKLV